ncbi:MAG: hypothetical protein ACTHQQ_14030 [Solirubrobacteraceae bacterium]
MTEVSPECTRSGGAGGDEVVMDGLLCSVSGRTAREVFEFLDSSGRD